MELPKLGKNCVCLKSIAAINPEGRHVIVPCRDELGQRKIPFCYNHSRDKRRLDTAINIIFPHFCPNKIFRSFSKCAMEKLNKEEWDEIINHYGYYVIPNKEKIFTYIEPKGASLLNFDIINFYKGYQQNPHEKNKDSSKLIDELFSDLYKDRKKALIEDVSLKRKVDTSPAESDCEFNYDNEIVIPSDFNYPCIGPPIKLDYILDKENRGNEPKRTKSESSDPTNYQTIINVNGNTITLNINISPETLSMLSNVTGNNFNANIIV